MVRYELTIHVSLSQNTARPAALQLSTAFPPLYYVRPLLFVLLEGSTPPSGYGSEEGPFAYAFSGTCGLACAPGGLPDARGFP